ncbi:GNAT family N-acetyltransferase [Nocardia carnea]|uniref:GNAT family N-acetyltransferase n=1 Tax=Nocardia carnea TaxID=37328 RepID=UPI000683E25E|nr:GNAT family N-acetyltransferase [Nocardia carnea]
MWVDPAARGSGIAGLLVRAVIAHTTTRGCTQIRLEIIGDNTPAERLYTRHGFVRTGLQRTVAPDDPRTEFEMTRSAQ